MCDFYRSALELYIVTIDLPFKNEVFDEIDNYIKKRQTEGVILIEEKSKWRDAIPGVKCHLIENYIDQLYMEMHLNKIDTSKLPDNFIPELAEQLVDQFLKSENTMLHSWNLWKPVSVDIVRVIHELRIFEHNKLSVEYIMEMLEILGHFGAPNYDFTIYRERMILAQRFKHYPVLNVREPMHLKG